MVLDENSIVTKYTFFKIHLHGFGRRTLELDKNHQNGQIIYFFTISDNLKCLDDDLSEKSGKSIF